MSDLISREAALAALAIRPDFSDGSAGFAFAAITIASLPAAPAVKVKPIKFTKRGVDWWGACPFGIYIVAEADTDAGRKWAFWQPDADEDDTDAASGFFSTEQEALEAAQADYERDILAALEGGEA